MKNNLKKILFLLTTIILISCSQEIYENHDHEHKHDKNEITFKQFKKESEVKNFSLIKSANITSSNARAIESGFIVDTTKILKHIDVAHNKITYSFKIFPLINALNSREYYNLVVEKKGSEIHELIFLNTKKENAQIGESKLESSDLVYSSRNGYVVESMCEVVTYTFNCTCIDKSNCDMCSVCIKETVSYQPCSTFGEGGSSGGGTGGIVIGDNGGGGEPSSIYIPNPYEGEEDPNNQSFVLAGQISSFITPIKNSSSQIQNLFASTYWLHAALIDFGNDNDNFTQEDKAAITFALNNIGPVFTAIYQNSNNLSANEIDELKYKALNFLLNNPGTTSEKYLNWFLGRVEGKDSFYNDSFWQNSNLNFPQQQLPTWNDFNNSFPRNSDGTLMTGADNVFGYVGGSVLQARIDNPDTTNNTCALKVSIALNGSGVFIPNIPGQTLEGGSAFAGKFFFLNAKALNNWMKLTFGTNPSNPNHHQFNQDQGGTNGEGFVSALNDLQPNHGIFTMLPISAIEFGASGHCDIFDGTNCGSHCYFDSANEINIWILP